MEQDFDLTTPEGVTALMETSQSAEDWNANCDRIKKANGGGYPNFWFATIMMSGVGARIAKRWGADTNIRVTSG